MKPQSFANHRALPHPAFLASGLLVLLGAGYQLWQAAHCPSCGSVLIALGSLAVLPIWFAARRNAQIVQDRVIRLEMQLRLARLLPNRDLTKLTLPQIIALRFASDAELPALIDRVLAGELTTPDAIKQAVREWQADWLRV